MDKKSVVHVHDGILLDREKEGNLMFATAWIDWEIIMLSEMSQLVKDKCHVISLTCGM